MSIATEPSIEQRLAALEAAIAEIRSQLPLPKSNWLDQVSGSMKDKPAFEEVIALGRAYRMADRPPRMKVREIPVRYGSCQHPSAGLGG